MLCIARASKLPMTIGERITKARESAGLTLADLARKIGISRAAVGQIESGETKSPRAENLSKIAAVTATRFQWLLDGSGEMRAHSTQVAHKNPGLSTTDINGSDTSLGQDYQAKTGEEEMIRTKVINLFDSLSLERQLLIFEMLVVERERQEKDRSTSPHPTKQRA